MVLEGCFFRPTAGHKEWATKANLHLDMNAWAWLGDGAALRKHLDTLTYENTSCYINENNQASHTDGLQLQAALNLIDNYEQDGNRTCARLCLLFGVSNLHPLLNLYVCVAGGFICVPGFQHEFNAYYSDPALSGPPRLERSNVDYLPKDPLQKRAVRVPMRAGSIVIWDQRLPHGSWPNQGTTRPRFVHSHRHRSGG